MQYRFTRNIMVDGVPYADGDVIEADGILAGCVESCLYTGALVPVENGTKARASKDEPEPGPEPQPQPVRKPKR